MTTFLIILHILVCLFLIGIVLLQQGKGGGMGAALGGGGSNQSVFGADGPMPILSKVTTGAAVIFMLTSLALAYISSHDSSSSVMKQISVPKQNENGIEKTLVPAPDVSRQSEEDAPVSE